MKPLLRTFAVPFALLVTFGGVAHGQDSPASDSAVTLTKVVPAPVEVRNPKEVLSAPRHTTFPQDQLFVKEVLLGNLMEAEVGQIAVRQGTRQEIKTLGQRLIEDRTRMDQLMGAVAYQLSVTPPEEVSKKDLAFLSMLQGMSGSEFDQAFLRWTIRNHKRRLGDFKVEASMGNTRVAQQVASQGAEMIHEHLQMIEHIAQSAGSTAKLGE